MPSIFDSQNYMKELVEHSSTFFYAEKLYDTVEVVSAGENIPFGECPTIIIDSESEYGRSFEKDRHSHGDLKKIRPNSLILVSHLVNKDTDMQFYPIDWIKVVSANLSMPRHLNTDTAKTGLCMLGGWTPRRKKIYEKLIKFNGDIMISYYPRQSSDWDEDHNFDTHCYVDPLIEKMDISEFQSCCIENGRLFTQEMVPAIKDNNIIYSQLIPQQLYACSDIQFVAETEDDFQLKEKRQSHGFYVTEKSGKALYSGKPWVIYGAEGFLKNLRELGFETFGDIIDESYDNERCSFKRAEHAADSFIEFITQPERVRNLALKKAKSRCIKNKKLVSDFNAWLGPVEEKIRKMI